MAKAYNTTDLRPDQAFERHVFHRDQFAHYLRWTHILKEAKIGESIVDFGCGAANLLEVLYRNKFKQKEYIGIDIREKQFKKQLRSMPMYLGLISMLLTLLKTIWISASLMLTKSALLKCLNMLANRMQMHFGEL